MGGILAGSCIWTWSTFFLSGRTVGRSENLIGGEGVIINPTPFGFVSKDLLHWSCYIPLVIVPQKINPNSKFCATQFDVSNFLPIS